MIEMADIEAARFATYAARVGQLMQHKKIFVDDQDQARLGEVIYEGYTNWLSEFQCFEAICEWSK